MLKRTIFFLLIFSLPFQLGYHFWLPQSFVSSFRLDYLSPTLYLTDVFIIFYLSLHPKIIFRSLKNLFITNYGRLFLLLIFLNLLSSSFNPITFFAWLRFLEYYLLFQTLRAESNLLKKMKTPFLLSLSLVLALAFLQFVHQASLGGPFYFLGERPLSLSAPNIAKLNLPSAICHMLNTKCQILRPYSTFSHPNSLAGYLLIVFVLLPLFTRSKLLKTLTLFTIFLTFSKAAIFTLIFITIIPLSLSQSLVLSLLLSLTPLLQSATNLPSWINFSFISRQHLLPLSLEIIKDHWLFGVGLRQFIPSLTNFIPGNQLSYQTLQPVHNLFLLVLAELGLLPILFILFFIIHKNHFRLATSYSPLATIILLTGAVDHYWWTLPQNQLIIVLAISTICKTTVFSPKLGEKTSLL